MECEHKEIEPLRKALYDFYGLLQGTTDAGNPTLIEYNNYLTIAHLSNLKFIYESKPAAQNLHQKLSVALLRYCEYIRLDKLFYEAGISCQKNVLFVLFRIFIHWLLSSLTATLILVISSMIQTTVTSQRTTSSTSVTFLLPIMSICPWRTWSVKERRIRSRIGFWMWVWIIRSTAIFHSETARSVQQRFMTPPSFASNARIVVKSAFLLATLSTGPMANNVRAVASGPWKKRGAPI